MKTTAQTSPRLRPLKGVRILSLALNLPGPAALMRCRHMGATCVKLEPPARPDAPSASSGDPMAQYHRATYEALHEGIRITVADLKTRQGQATLHKELARSDIVVTSFRPSALKRLGLDWKVLHPLYPRLALVAIVGATGARAQAPGHDLTYMAENDLITGLDLPPTLYADMGGSLLASEAILQARLHQLQTGTGIRLEIVLSAAAGYLALPRHWGLSAKGSAVGGGHAGYGVFACKDGRVALAALEPHFAAALGAVVGLEDVSAAAMFAPQTHAAVAQFLRGRTRSELEALAAASDIPLHTLP